MLILVAVILAACFGLVIFRGAPYVPTLRSSVELALDVARLGKGQTIIDLGSGDGRLLRAAADRGLNAVGYEINPVLVLVSWLKCRKYGKRVRVRMKDLWSTPLPDDTDAVFVFLADPFMARLARYLQSEATRLKRPLILVSYGFEVPGHTPVRRNKAVLCYEIQP